MAKVDFDSNTPSVMIMRSGHKLWLQDLVRLVSTSTQWAGKVASMTHPDYEMGDIVYFDMAEVRDTDTV